MSVTEINKSIVTRFNKAFIEEGNTDVFKEIMSPDFINHTAPAGMPKGPEGVMYFFNDFLKKAFPELRVEILQQVAEDDFVTTHKIFYTIHKGDFMGIPATGQEVTIEVIDILRLKQERFIEHWNVLDWQNVIQQLNH